MGACAKTVCKYQMTSRFPKGWKVGRIEADHRSHSTDYVGLHFCPHTQSQKEWMGFNDNSEEGRACARNMCELQLRV